MSKVKILKIIVLIIQLVLFIAKKPDLKRLEFYDLYINIIMPLFFIITLIISLLKNKGNRNVVNGNDVNNINNEPGNNDDAVLVENENGNGINNGQLNEPSEINDENQNLGQPNEQPAVGGNQGNEIINEYKKDGGSVRYDPPRYSI